MSADQWQAVEVMCICGAICLALFLASVLYERVTRRD